MKILETLRSNNKSYVLINKLSLRSYILVLPLVICLCGGKYLMKVQPIVYYESRYYDMLFTMFIFVIPINNMHKSEINSLAPIRLDQGLIRENLVDILKKFRLLRYNAFIM